MELAAGCIEGTLLGFRFVVREDWSAFIADVFADDRLDRLAAKGLVPLQRTDDLATEHPDIVAVPAQGGA